MNINTTKTAISLPLLLFRQVNALAHDLNMARSRVFAMAVEEFLQKRRNRRLLENLNDAYREGPDGNERIIRKKTRDRHRRMTEGEW